MQRPAWIRTAILARPLNESGAAGEQSVSYVDNLVD